MLRRLGQWLGATRLPGGSRDWSPDWLASAGLPPHRGAVDPSQLAAALRSASILSDALASAPPAVYVPVVGGGREMLVNDAARCLMRTRFADWETCFLSCQLGGNGFLRVVRNERGGAHSLQGIPARLVSVVIDRTGRVWYEISADETLGISEQTVNASDIIHVKARNTDNAVVGVSPLRAAGASIANAVETYSLQKSLFHNLNNAGLAFSTDLELTADQMNQLRDRVDKQTKGYAAGGSIILSNGLKIDRGGNGTTAHDETLIEALEFTTREIARAFGVPPSMLAQADQSSYSTASEERRHFVTATLEPWAARVASELTAKLVTPEDQTAGVAIAYDFTASLMGHGEERADALSKLVNAGIMSVNESRNLMGMSDVEGGDMLRSPSNTYPMDAWLDFKPSQDTPEAAEETPEEAEGEENASDAPEEAEETPEEDESDD